MKWTAFESIRRFSKPGSLNISNNAFSEDAANSDLNLTLPNGFSMVKLIYLSDNIYLFLFLPPGAKCRQQNIIVIIFKSSWSTAISKKNSGNNPFNRGVCASAIFLSCCYYIDKNGSAFA
jgi:hypothetical protein